MGKKEEKKYSKRGNPFKRGETWTIIYYPIIDGKKVQRYKGGFKTKKLAQEELNKINAQILNSTYVEKVNLTVKSFLDDLFLEWQEGLRDSTKSSYSINIYKHIIPVIGDIKLTDLNEQHLRKLFENLRQKGLCETSVNYVYRVLRKALDFAVKKRKLAVNPCYFLINTPKPRDYTSVSLSPKEYKEFINLTQKSKYSLEILLALRCGLRRGEILGITVKNINFEKKIILLEQQLMRNQWTKTIELTPLKTRWSKRIIPFDSELEKLIKERIALNKSRIENYNETCLLCCNENGKTLTPASLSKIIKPIARQINKPDLTLHNLRHICGERLLEKGKANPKAVQALLGHSDISTTMNIYCKNAKMEEAIREAMYEAEK